MNEAKPTIASEERDTGKRIHKITIHLTERDTMTVRSRENYLVQAIRMEARPSATASEREIAETARRLVQLVRLDEHP